MSTEKECGLKLGFGVRSTPEGQLRMNLRGQKGFNGLQKKSERKVKKAKDTYYGNSLLTDVNRMII